MENPRPRLRRRRRFSPRAGYCVLSSLLSSPPFPGFLSLSRYHYYCAAPPLLSFCGMRACIQRSRGALPPLLIASSSSSSSGGYASVASLFLPRMDDVRSRWQRRSPPLSSTIRSLFLRKERGGCIRCVMQRRKGGMEGRRRRRRRRPCFEPTSRVEMLSFPLPQPHCSPFFTFSFCL